MGYDFNAGQTMIETLVAIFMLTMGVSAALGLAIFAFSSSANISKQIVATGLAREGLEAVKQMRDTNWLQQTSIDNNCWNYKTLDLTAFCYKSWLGTNISAPYCIDPSNSTCDGLASSRNYSLGFDSSSSLFWVLSPQNGTNNFGLKLDTVNPASLGFYNSTSVACDSTVSGISDFCRKITITKTSNLAPYNQATEGPLLKVQSFVWWVDKKCPRVPDWPQASPTCRLELDMYLTNWKNY